MVTCDVSKKSRYGVESYDYTIKYRLDDEYISKKIFTNNHSYKNRDPASNKRNFTDRGNVKLRLGKRVNSDQPIEEKQEARILPDLIVTADHPTDQIIQEITEKLSEEKKELVGVYK